MATAVSTALSFPALNSHNLRRKKLCRISCMVYKYPSGFIRGSKRIEPKLGVTTTEGEGNMPMVVLSIGGCEVEIYLFGGCITSWRIPTGKDMLFVRPDAVFNKKKPISGGMPHCFPQFGPGALQQHGFARNMDWSLVDSAVVDDTCIAVLELRDGPYSRSMWDYSFKATYKVGLSKNSLVTELIIKNTDSKAFSFNSALHTYFRAFVQRATVRGLKGCKTLNKDPDPKNPIEGKEERDAVTFPGFVDCIYLDTPNLLELENGIGDVITITNENWSDTVLWNPHKQMEPFYKNFVCVENAKIGTVQLAPQDSWTALQMFSVQ